MESGPQEARQEGLGEPLHAISDADCCAGSDANPPQRVGSKLQIIVLTTRLADARHYPEAGAPGHQRMGKPILAWAISRALAFVFTSCKLAAMERGLMHAGVESLASTSSPHAGRCAGLQSSASPSHRAAHFTPRCLARSKAPGQSHRAAQPLRAATVEAPAVDQNGEAPGREYKRTGSIREQAHRRGTHTVRLCVYSPILQLPCRGTGRCPPALQTPGGEQAVLCCACIMPFWTTLKKQAGCRCLQIYSIRSWVHDSACSRAYHVSCRSPAVLSAAAPLDKGHLFRAKYVPFEAVLGGDPWASEESYSLDDVIYRRAGCPQAACSHSQNSIHTVKG